MSGEWQPISTAPKDGTPVLLGDFKEKDPTEHSIGVARLNNGAWAGDYIPDWYWSHGFAPTHWMPLPEPPVPVMGGGK